MKYKTKDTVGKPLLITRRFGVMAAVTRRKCSANLEDCRPQEVQWKPPLRQAAGTLCDTRGQCVFEKFQTKKKYLLKFDYLCSLDK
jgi:hypothetical protein